MFDEQATTSLSSSYMDSFLASFFSGDMTLIYDGVWNWRCSYDIDIFLFHSSELVKILKAPYNFNHQEKKKGLTGNFHTRNQKHSIMEHNLIVSNSDKIESFVIWVNCWFHLLCAQQLLVHFRFFIHHVYDKLQSNAHHNNIETHNIIR